MEESASSKKYRKSVGVLALLLLVANSEPRFLRGSRTASAYRVVGDNRLTPVYRCGEIGKDLVSNFVSKNYPNNDVTAGDCRFRLIITSPSICQVRVDFVDTELLPPVKGDCLSQQFEVEGPLWPTGLPPLCGINNDQHFYLHLEPWTTNITWVDFRVSTVASGNPYRFGVWITQIDCATQNLLKAPEGCTQYFLGEKGTIKSFNYLGKSHLHGQNYRICIRSSKGVCGVRFDAGANDFSIRRSTWPVTKEIQAKAASGLECGLDYLLIPNIRDDSRKRRGRLFFSRPFGPSNSIILVNTNTPKPKQQQAQQQQQQVVAYSVPTTPATTSTTTTTRATTAAATTASTVATTMKALLGMSTFRPPVPVVIQQQQQQQQQLEEDNFRYDSDRFCGGVLSSHNGDKTPRPLFAKVSSNLIDLQFTTASTTWRKSQKRTKLLNVETLFRISYAQTRTCDFVESDLAGHGDVFSVLHSMDQSDIQDFHHHHEFLPSLRDREMLMEAGSDVGLELSSNGTDSQHLLEDDPAWDYLEEMTTSDEEAYDGSTF